MAFLKNYFEFLSSNPYISHPEWELPTKSWEKWEWYQQGPEKMKKNGGHKRQY